MKFGKQLNRIFNTDIFTEDMTEAEIDNALGDIPTVSEQLATEKEAFKQLSDKVVGLEEQISSYEGLESRLKTLEENSSTEGFITSEDLKKSEETLTAKFGDELNKVKAGKIGGTGNSGVDLPKGKSGGEGEEMRVFKTDFIDAHLKGSIVKR